MYQLTPEYIKVRNEYFDELILYICENDYHEKENLENILIEDNFILGFIDVNSQKLIKSFEDCEMEAEDEFKTTLIESF